MAHPYESHRQEKTGHSRAQAITKGYARGGRAPSKVNVNINLPPPPHGSEKQAVPPLPPVPAMGPPGPPGVTPVSPGGAGPFARGGKIPVPMTGGADSGIGRIDKSKAYKRGQD